jgi:hypothetical protein
MNSSGLLSGTPAAPGSFNVTLQVTDRAQVTASKSLTLIINAANPPSITTVSPLPAGVVDSPYTQTFSAIGGTPPYRWSLGNVVAFPPDITLNAATGVLSGTPGTRGDFSFTVQVTDSTGQLASRVFALTITSGPLAITTGTLFNGTVGIPYSQTFSATGGTPPYRWSIRSGATAGLTFDGNSGVLAGTPTSAGSFPFTIQVTDSAGGTASKDFTLIVDIPRLTILTASPLPSGTAGSAYSQRFSATGGTPPYTWSIISGSIAGLLLEATSATLSGTPTDSGTFNITVQVRDSGGQTSAKLFALTVNPSPLTITTPLQLPDAVLGQPFSYAVTALGGVPPYSWSALGLPDGLSIDVATGILSGTPPAGGSFGFAVTVTDAVRASATARLQLTVGMPAIPAVTITGLPDTANAADQPSIRVTLAEPYPAPITGQLNLSFTPEAGAGDSTIQFATGGRTATFTIPAGSTTSAAALSLQTGTVAGTIRITAQFQSSGIDITPTPAPSQGTRIRQAAPVIASARLVRMSNGFNIQITGYSTAREITQAVFHFTAASGSTLQTSDITIPVQSIFSQWFQNPASTAFGSQFTFTQPFTVQGDPNAVIPESVSLTNTLGNTTATIAR